MISPHFNLTVELPLKAIVRGFTWKVVPITWRNRRTGLANLKTQRNGEQIPIHMSVRLAREVLKPR
jgi:dolichol-phosphate mannosyltransferase